MGRFPALISAGPIEATVPVACTLDLSKFPALISAGPIEATASQ